MKQEIAVIGYGRFGAVVAEQLRQFFSIGICEKNKSIHLGPEIHRLSLAEAATRNIIVLAVPIGRMKPLLQNLAPLLRPKTLVFDVCSVKEQPIQWMKNILPAHSYILGTHPLFGPDSAGKRLAGKPIVLCPVRIPASRFRKIVHALRTTGMDIFVMT
ncbi:MAG TPA: prephenate dehydrogenase/arogenate dehydrogenase family protein, partial [Bacteroidota bacterium]|nr:prephenate dehydrogenase/arogenate dehydrogenase family protein [Bacteroidota bacterium]